MKNVHAVEIHVDPACPWAWLGSRWLVQLEDMGLVSIRWRVLVVADVNRREGEQLDPNTASVKAGRLLLAARRSDGESTFRALYTELGEARHERAEDIAATPVLQRAAVGAGLEASFVGAALADPRTLSELIEETRAARARGIFGVPTLTVPGSPPFFGPVLDSRVADDDAAGLWEHVSWLLQQPHFFEIKRERTGNAQVGRERLNATAGAAA